jgi:hypothetical protein
MGGRKTGVRMADSVNKRQHQLSYHHLAARMTKTKSTLMSKLQTMAKLQAKSMVKANQVSDFSARFQPSGNDHLLLTLQGETGSGHLWKQ